MALGAYAVLAVLVWTTLDNQQIRWASLAVLALFAVKTVVRRKDVMHAGGDEEED
jgi:hypothetical protein